jgi:stress-induced-phosphoprotein 1
MASLKEQGGAAFKAKEFDKAIDLYTKAIAENGSDHTLYSNRSACFYNQNKFQEAAEDGQKCIDIKADWGKGYMRKAMALHGLRKYEEAIPIYKKGVEIEPSNKQLTDGLARCEDEKLFSESGPQGGAGMGGGMGGPGGLGDMFGPAGMAKLMANPRTAAYFQDVQFKTMFEMCKQQPQMLMQVMQSDPRFMDVFQVLTGIDLMGMQQEYQKSQDQAKDDQKKKDEEMKKKKEEEEQKKKEEEQAKLPEEERKKIQDGKDAEAKKLEGNAAYKKKDFENALKLYQEAIDLNPDELTFYTNKSAVYLEMKEFQKGIDECDKAIEKTKGKQYDYSKLAKTLARKATCQMKKGDMEEAIETYKNALLEDNSV